MAKRIVAGALGTIAVLGSFLLLWYTFEDYKSPNLGQLVICSIAIPALWLGVRFVRFAVFGRIAQTNSLASSIFLGIGFFFPGFVFSLPLTILLSSDTRIEKSFLAAVGFSVCIGVAAAMICTIVSVRKHAVPQNSHKNR